jgi:transcriptional regulator with XRE-family HTH domain
VARKAPSVPEGMLRLRPAEAIVWIRERMGLTQTEFGSLLGGVSQSTIARWESGYHKPSHAYQRQLAPYLRRLLETAPPDQLPESLLDLGSQVSEISPAAAAMLQLPREHGTGGPREEGLPLPDYGDLERLAHEGAVKLEVTGGVPTWEAFPSLRHQRLVDRIRATIAPRGTGSGGCACLHIADVYFRFPDGSLKRPDIAILCTEPPDQDEALTIIPDAVIEIVSRGYEFKDLTLNPPFYLLHGVQDVVIYDPAAAFVIHHTRNGVVHQYAPVQLSLICGCDCAIPQ